MKAKRLLPMLFLVSSPTVALACPAGFVQMVTPSVTGCIPGPQYEQPRTIYDALDDLDRRMEEGRLALATAIPGKKVLAQR